MNREANVGGSGFGNSSNNGAVEDNIPTSIADQALQALDSEDEIVNTKLERSKMQQWDISKDTLKKKSQHA